MGYSPAHRVWGLLRMQSGAMAEAAPLLPPRQRKTLLSSLPRDIHSPKLQQQLITASLACGDGEFEGEKKRAARG